MKLLFFIAAADCVLAGCSMPRRGSGSMPNQDTGQASGNMAIGSDYDRIMCDDNMWSWVGGDGSFFGALNMGRCAASCGIG